MCTNYDADVIIFDRTPFDNYMYLLMRESEHCITPKNKIENIKLEYDYLIENLMDCFDLMFFIRRKTETGKCKTKYVTPKERKHLLNLYDKYTIEYIPTIHNVFETRGKEYFAEDVKNTSKIMAEKIKDYYYL